MTATKPQVATLSYPRKTVERAERALSCSPFNRALFTTMRSKSVALGEIAGEFGEKQQFTSTPLSEDAVENALLWLIQVGILRREVDGQGITNSFRLTPLGREIIARADNVSEKEPTPTWRDRLFNALSRWFRLPL